VEHHENDEACEIARGALPVPSDGRTLVAVFASPVADHLLHFARDLGYRTVLVEPDLGLVSERGQSTHELASTVDPSFADGNCDVVVTDHDRPELGMVLKKALETPARWIGVMGSKRHEAQHIPALQGLGVADADIARVRRPIGLNIGSKSPAEIAVATLAGLIADRNEKPGGFTF
jgi:xanthine/CO dehydrogenase XdhC/CoxF family maturation factor